MQSHLTRIEPLNQWEALLTFSTGSYRIPFFEIRRECNCAECVDEWSGERKIKGDSLPKTVRPLAVKLVGNYAVSIHWSDGHQTGIYSFERLLQLCHEFGVKLESYHPFKMTLS